MRICDVSPRVCNPPRRGAAVRIHNLLCGLSERHEVRQVSLARLIRSVEGRTGLVEVTPSYRELCFRSRAALLGELPMRSWTSAPLLAGAVLRLSAPPELDAWLGWADLALIEFPWAFAECRRRAGATPLVLATHNFELAKFRSWADAAGAGRLRASWLRWVERCEREAMAGAELVLAVSPEEAELFATHYGVARERIAVVPNGADTRRYRPADRDARRAARRALGLPERPTVIFMGNRMPGNHAGLRWVERVARATDAMTFLVVGPVSPPRREGSLVATGEVDDLVPWLRAADLALCPIQHGAGTKLKLLETMAAGIPSVAFAEAVRGLAARDGEHVVVAKPDAGALLAALEALAAEPDHAERIGRAASALVASRYDWRAIAAELGAELERRFGGGAAR